MLKAAFKDNSEYEITNVKPGQCSGLVNGEPFSWNVLKTGENTWHVIDKSGDSFYIELIQNLTNGYALKIDDKEIEVSSKSEFDVLLDKMGISASTSKKIKNLKAPMPGLVLTVDVQPGDQVKKGDKLLILEAMKMENVIKAEADVTVKSVKITPQTTIEKGELMLEFE